MVAITPVSKVVGESLQVSFLLRNSGSEGAAFPVGVSIGKDSINRWHDVDVYNDGRGSFVQVSLAPGAQASDSRRLDVIWDGSIGPSWDVWITVRNPSNENEIIDEVKALGVLQVSQSSGGYGLRAAFPGGTDVKEIRHSFARNDLEVAAFCWMRKSSTSQGYALMRLYGDSQERIALGMHPDGQFKIEVVSGTSSTWMSTVPYQANKWYQVTLLFNTQNRWWNLWIQDEANNVLYSNHGQGPRAGFVNMVGLLVGYGQVGSSDAAMFDDVRVDDFQDSFDDGSISDWEWDNSWFALSAAAQRPG